MAENKHTIILDKDNKDDIKIEKVGDSNNKIDKSTFFHEEYSKAYSIVESITEYYARRNSNNNNNESEKKEKFVKNNIILFSGSRGTGKTSAMASFGKYLESITFEGEKDKKKFGVLEMIDPSYFQKNKSILLSVITLLFKNVKKGIDKNQNYNTDLLQKFEKVFKSVKKMEDAIPEESTLEYLSQLSDSLELKNSIGELIQEYLKSIESNFKYLVLMIDDLDLNVAQAPIMLEQIRKYLIHERIIILISSNINQLQIELKENYSKYFAKTLSIGSDEKSTAFVDVEDMATKYLLKLFPPLQRINIGNSADKLINTDIKYYDGNKDKDKKGKDLQKYILSLIWERTRLIFIPEKGTLHPIIPTNLRALRYFVYMLKEQMVHVDLAKQKDNIFKDEKTYKAIRENFDKFKDYILNVWIPSNVSFEEQQIFNNIPKEIDRINKHLIQSINMIGEKYKKKIRLKDFATEHNIDVQKRLSDRDIYTFVSVNDPRYIMANKISDIYNYPSNNSMGDILLLVDKYKTYFESIEDNNFIEAVKIYYSILLFETMFFNDDDNKTLKNNSNLLKNGFISPPEILNIQKLIGGTLYFPHYFNIIKNKEYEKIIFLIKEIEKILKNENEKVELTKDFISNFCNERNATEHVKVIEKILLDNPNGKRKYFYKGQGDDVEEHLFYHEYDRNKNDYDLKKAFFVLYYGKSRPQRSSDEHIYDTKKIGEKEEERFDILSLPVNILNIWHSIYRFGTNSSSKYEIPNNIEEWLKTKTVLLTGGCFVPNFLLPVYSVDLMLIYLKNSVNYEDLKDITKVEATVKTETKTLLDIKEETMRDITVIADYYDKLKKITTDKLEEIDIVEIGKKTTISEIYTKIYTEGRKVFLEEQPPAIVKRKGGRS